MKIMTQETKYKKREIVNRLVEVRQKILEVTQKLPEEKWDEIFLGRWNLKDLFAHLIGWDIWGLKATEEIIRGKLPGYYKYYDENWEIINEMFVRKYKKGSKGDLIVRMQKERARLVKELHKVPQKLYNKDFGIRWKGRRVTLATDTLYQADDELVHLKQIMRWIKTRGPK